MLPRPPRYTRPHTRVPYTTLFRSDPHVGRQPTDPHHVGDMAMDVEHVGAPRLNQRALARHVQIFARIELGRSEEHTSELQSLMRTSYAVFCLKKKKTITMRTAQ